MADSGAVRREPGALKRAVLRILWDAPGPLTAREVRVALGENGRTPALTTVLTVFERMRSSGEVVRSRGAGREYTFTPASDESQTAASSMLETLLAAGDRSGALVQFSGSLSEGDAAVLRHALSSRTPSRRAQG